MSILLHTINFSDDVGFINQTGISFIKNRGLPSEETASLVTSATVSPAQSIAYSVTWAVDPVAGDVVEWDYDGLGNYTDSNYLDEDMLSQSLILTNCWGEAYQSFVLIGDSITEINSSFPKATGLINQRGFWTNIIAMCEQKAVYVNQGVAGEDTDELLARFNTDVVALNPGKVIIEGGLNDLINADGIGRDPDLIIADLDAMYDMALANGIEPIGFTIWQDEVANGGFTAVQLASMNKINNFVTSSKKIICYIDGYSAMTDASSGALQLLVAGASDDGVHPSYFGAYLIAISEYPKIYKLLTGKPTTVITANNNAKQLFNNPFMSGVAGVHGGVNTIGTGDLADNWTSLNINNACTSHTYSKVAHPVEGFWQQCVLVATATNQSVRLESGSVASSLGAGDEFYAECELEIDDVSGIDNVACKLQMFTNEGTFDCFSTNVSTNGSGGYKVTLKTEVHIAVASMTNTRFRLDARPLEAGTYTFKFGRCSIRKK